MSKNNHNNTENAKDVVDVSEDNIIVEGGGVNNKKSKGFLKVITIIALILIIVTGASDIFYTVKDGEQAVVTTFDKMTSIEDAGLHFKLPFIQAIQKVQVQKTYKMEIGYRVGEDGILEAVPQESSMITGDFNIVNTDFFVEYKISDPVKVLYNSTQPDIILKNLTQSAARSVIATKTVDDVLTTGKAQIQAEMKELITEDLEGLDIGLMLLDVKVQDSEPPTSEVITAFKSVENAKQEKETKINNAYAYKNEQIPKAKADADKIVKDAEAYKEEKINEANGQVAKLNEMYEEYSKFEDVTKTRMYLETIEEILPKVNTIIDTNGSNNGKLFTMPITGSNANVKGEK